MSDAKYNHIYCYQLPYDSFQDIDFSIITSQFKYLPFYDTDLYLGMQALNIGIVDTVITQSEYSLLQEWIEIERTPIESALTVSAMSQMWVFGLYEVLRMWRDRRFQFKKLFENGGIDLKIENMPKDDPYNLTIQIRKDQLMRYKEEASYRENIDAAWNEIEKTYRMTELFRMNMAKHAAPGKDSILPRTPGYGRINMTCGAMDYELVEKEGYYQLMNRRDIADALRRAIKNWSAIQ